MNRPSGRLDALRRRSSALETARVFFRERDFLEVQTPVLVPSPGLDVHLEAFEVVTDPPRFLSTSPEYQMKRLLSEGLPRIYQIAPAFRRDESGERHNPEFTILEFYRAHASVEDVMQDTEALVERMTEGEVRLPDAVVDSRAPFDVMTVRDAFERFAGISKEETIRLAEKDEDTFFRVLVDRVEPALARLRRAVFLTEYPASQASLARKKPGDAEVAERFELYVAGVELCNGFGELTDAVEQRARLVNDQATRRARGLAVYPIDEKFMGALEEGLPPCAGNAVGLDRLIALSCGTKEIADVMAFTERDL